MLLKKGIAWYVAPTYAQTVYSWEIILNFLGKLIAKKQDFLKRIVLINGSIIEFKSAEEYENLRGVGLDFLVVDEAARIKQEAWEQVLRPTLIEKKGEAMFLSTPKGKNWFYWLYLKGIEGDPQYESFRFPSWTSPFVPKEEIELLRRSLPEDVFRQEIEADFIDNTSRVFRNYRDCVKGSFEEPVKGQKYVLGWDPAKYEDFSVVSVLNMDRHLVYFERMQQIDYTFQIQKVESIAKQYNNATIYMDATGVGDPLFEALQRRGLQVHGVVLTNATKKNLIETLALTIEQKEITFPEIRELMLELEAFEYEITRAGNVSYSAPPGFHDDCVLSLALAVYGWKQEMSIQQVEIW